MSTKTSIEEAAGRLEAIARTRRVQEAIGEIAERFEVETTLKKASGLEGVSELTAAEAAKSLRLSGDAVARALSEMGREQQ